MKNGSKKYCLPIEGVICKMYFEKIIELNILCWTWVSSCSSITSTII